MSASRFAGLSAGKLRIVLDVDGVGPDTFVVRGMTGNEGISSLFSFDLDLVSPDGQVDLGALLGAKGCVRILLADGSCCHINGIFSRWTYSGSATSLHTYQAQLVPSLWLLDQGANCRVFQNATVPEIVSRVIEDAAAGVVVDDSLLAKPYEPREYCVQYRESDFDFVSRLLEEEGIHFFFAHEEKAHRVMLSDDSTRNPDCPGKAEYQMQGPSSEPAGHEDVLSFEISRSIVPGRFACADYDFKSPAAPVSGDAGGPTATWGAPAVGPEFEVFEYPARSEKPAVVKRWAAARAAEQCVGGEVAVGQGGCRTLRAGHVFCMGGHCRPEAKDAQLVLTVQHRASQRGVLGSEMDGAAGAPDLDYDVQFTSLPAATPFVPPRRTPRPTIGGLQPAVVCGKDGEDIWTDKYGRVMVRFFWDRDDRPGEKRSCWVRVAYGVAGKSWGQIFIPRVGQEVLVAFLDGDPDRPVVVGGVYNDAQKPPYTLPDGRTRSTIKTRSSRQGSPDNYNEIRFEDKKGAEEVLIRAERDLNVVVGKRAETTTGEAFEAVCGQSKLKLDKGGKIEISGTDVTLKTATGTVRIDAGGIITIKGTMVRIN